MSFWSGWRLSAAPVSSQTPMIHSFVHLIHIQGNFSINQNWSLKFWLDVPFMVHLHPSASGWVYDIFILDNCPAFLLFMKSFFSYQSLISFLCCTPHAIKIKPKSSFTCQQGPIVERWRASSIFWEQNASQWWLECLRGEQRMLPLFIIVISYFIYILNILHI